MLQTGEASLSAHAVVSLTRVMTALSFAVFKKNACTPESERRQRASSSGPSASTIIAGTRSHSFCIIATLAKLDPGATIAT
jgi:hypothetical protein